MQAQFVEDQRRVRKKKSRYTEITVETHETLFQRTPGVLATAWCSLCHARVRMASPEEAAAIAGVTTRTLYRWIEMGKLHFSEDAQGTLSICVPSVSRLKL
jgi:hypothetical protein